MKTRYELVSYITNMEKLAKGFRLSLLIKPSPKVYRKFIHLEVASPQQPNVALHCASCLYRLGFGYDRIARYMRLSSGASRKGAKHLVAKWVQRRRKLGLARPQTVRGAFWRPKSTQSTTRRARRLSAGERLAKSIRNKTQFKAKARLRSYFSQWLNRGLYPRLMGTVVGCDIHFLRHWLQSQFRGKMNWDNHGSIWHIDHIIPCKAFDLTKREDTVRCFHFSNLRPLFAKANMSKSAKIIPTQPELVLSFENRALSKEGTPVASAAA